MFDLWNEVDSDIGARIVSFQKDNCREHIDESSITVHECSICPYEDYSFLRLTYDEDQRVQVENGKRYEIKAGSISYLLGKINNEGLLAEVIPLRSNSQTLYAINKRLRLKLTSSTVVPYLVFYGIVIAGDEGSFYFVSNINHLNTVRSSLDESAKLTLDGIIIGSFEVDSDGNLKIKVEKKKYPLIGNAFKLSIPVIYSGIVYKTDVRISASGVPDMDDDEATTISGLDDKLPISQRYGLEFSPAIARIVRNNRLKNDAKIKYLTSTLLVERAISILLLPAYLLSLLIVFLLGMDNEVVYLYYNELKSINILTWINLIVGSILLIVVVLRFIVFEIGAFIEKLVPNQLSQFYQSVSGVVRNARNNLGIVKFILLGALEVSFGAVLALNIFIYGISNIASNMLVPIELNFIEALLLIIFSVPGVEPTLDWLTGIGDKIGLYSIHKDGLLVYLSSIVISSIVVGLVVRFIRMAKKSD